MIKLLEAAKILTVLDSAMHSRLKNIFLPKNSAHGGPAALLKLHASVGIFSCCLSFIRMPLQFYQQSMGMNFQSMCRFHFLHIVVPKSTGSFWATKLSSKYVGLTQHLIYYI
jgi:hypothetical protein